MILFQTRREFLQGTIVFSLQILPATRHAIHQLAHPCRMQMFSWMPAVADGEKGGLAVPADISWIDELTEVLTADDLEQMDLGEVELSSTIPRTRRMMCLVDLLALSCRTGTKRPRGAE